MRIPSQSVGAIQYDPSIIPRIALDRVDVLADGASATYVPDAIAGVINVILKRGFDGAIVQGVIGSDTGGGFNETTSGLYGRTRDSGDVTLRLQQGTQQPRASGRP